MGEPDKLNRAQDAAEYAWEKHRAKCSMCNKTDPRLNPRFQKLCPVGKRLVDASNAVYRRRLRISESREKNTD